MRRRALLTLGALALSCGKPAADGAHIAAPDRTVLVSPPGASASIAVAPDPIPDAGAAPIAKLADAPAGAVVVVVDANRCALAACDASACDVACPPEGELVTLDVQEGLSGLVTITLDGIVVLSREVTGASVTGLLAHVRARPARWPASVSVRFQPKGAAAITSAARVVQSERVVGISGSGGKVRIHAQAGPFGYD